MRSRFWVMVSINRCGKQVPFYYWKKWIAKGRQYLKNFCQSTGTRKLPAISSSSSGLLQTCLGNETWMKQLRWCFLQFLVQIFTVLLQLWISLTGNLRGGITLDNLVFFTEFFNILLWTVLKKFHCIGETL